ncbi:uncharacterized protein TNCV_2047921 [Trichonephila clavipes]|nr:uncharacterized protein TNCV_2047921 [Trichonephila clavipes]
MTQICANETSEEHATRLENARLRVRQSRSATSDELRSQQREHNKLQTAERRQQGTTYQPFNRLAFRYNSAEDYSLSRHILIGTMMAVCSYCKALKYSSETKGLCCAVGKIKLPQLREPPEPLKTCLARYTAESKHFISNIRKYNSCFQISSFGAEIITAHFMPTFKGDSKQRGQTCMVDQSYNKDQKSHMNSGSQLRTQIRYRASKKHNTKRKKRNPWQIILLLMTLSHSTNVELTPNAQSFFQKHRDTPWHLRCWEQRTFSKIPGVSRTHPAASTILPTKSSGVATAVS